MRAAQEEGQRIEALPGASALTAAVALSGLPSDRFCFCGFLPPKAGARGKMLEEAGRMPATLVFYETAPRLLDALEAIRTHLPGREVAVARELSKLHEECRRAGVETLIAHYTAHPPKGEIVLLIAPPVQEPVSAEHLDTLLRGALKENSVKDASAQIAEATGLPRSEVYARALALKES